MKNEVQFGRIFILNNLLTQFPYTSNYEINPIIDQNVWHYRSDFL